MCNQSRKQEAGSRKQEAGSRKQEVRRRFRMFVTSQQERKSGEYQSIAVKEEPAGRYAPDLPGFGFFKGFLSVGREFLLS